MWAFPLLLGALFLSLYQDAFSPFFFPISVQRKTFFSLSFITFLFLFSYPLGNPITWPFFFFFSSFSFRFCLLLTWHQQMVRTRGWCFGINSQGHVCEASAFGLSTLTQFRRGFSRADRFFESDLAIFLVLFPFKAFYFVLVMIWCCA